MKADKTAFDAICHLVRAVHYEQPFFGGYPQPPLSVAQRIVATIAVQKMRLPSIAVDECHTTFEHGHCQLA